jgi:hypothetical protein
MATAWWSHIVKNLVSGHLKEKCPLLISYFYLISQIYGQDDCFFLIYTNIFKIYLKIEFFKIFHEVLHFDHFTSRILDKVGPLKIWRETCMKIHLFLARYRSFFIKNAYSICTPCSNSNLETFITLFKTVQIKAISYVEIICDSVWFEQGSHLNSTRSTSMPVNSSWPQHKQALQRIHTSPMLDLRQVSLQSLHETSLPRLRIIL